MFKGPATESQLGGSPPASAFIHFPFQSSPRLAFINFETAAANEM